LGHGSGSVGGRGRGFRGDATAIRNDSLTAAIDGLTTAVASAGATTDVMNTTLATRATFATSAASAPIATKATPRITIAGDRHATDIATVTGYHAVTSVAAVTGHSLLLTTQQGDPDDREKNRDAGHDNSMHFESSKESTVVETNVAISGSPLDDWSHDRPPQKPTASRRDLQTSAATRLPPRKTNLYGLRNLR
jgi:hypothetical protein